MNTSIQSHLIAAYLAPLCTVAMLLASGQALAQRGLPQIIDPPEGSVQFGRSVASGGDANDDGVDDLFISDPGFEVDGVRVGRWFVYDGATRDVLWSVVGESPLGTDELSWSHLIVGAFIGDIDGDGGDDLIVGVPTTLQTHGAAIVYSGRTGDLLHRFDGQEFYHLGLDAAGVGDMNRDGTPDFAFVARIGPEGLVSFRSGRDGSEIFLVPASNPRRVRGVGDIDGDMHSDGVIGSLQRNNDPQINIISGRTGQATTIRPPGGRLESGFGYALAGGVDVTGDQVPDLLVGSDRNSTNRVVYVISGATLEVVNTIPDPHHISIFAIRVEFADMNGDGAYEALIGEGPGVGVYEPLTGRLIQWNPVGLSADFGAQVWYGNEFTTGSFNGDQFTDLLAPLKSGEVSLFGGNLVLLSLSDESIFITYTLPRGREFAFFVYGAQPGRVVHFLASRTGNGCTFIPQLGICIDLDRRIHRLGDAIADAEGFVQLSIQIGSGAPLGPVWLQAIDPNDPVRGPITSNVMRLVVVE